METLILLMCIVLLVAAIRSHVMAQAHVTSAVKRDWFERLFTGNRAPRDTLTEEGLRYRKQSNYLAIAGFVLLCVYMWVRTL